jgi:hypothetical protein
LQGFLTALRVTFCSEDFGIEELDRGRSLSRAERVLTDLSFAIDGNRLTPRHVSVDFPEVEEMKEGIGEIRIAFTMALPDGGDDRRFVFENHHQRPIAAYLVNCLTPRDRNIRVIAQDRNEEQSFYQLDYVQAGERSEPQYLKWWSGVRRWNGWPGAALLSLFAGVILLSGRDEWRQAYSWTRE